MQRKGLLNNSQLSIEEENPRITRLMDLFTIPVLPSPRVRHDQGQIISSHSSLISVEYTQYIIEQRSEKETKEEVAWRRRDENDKDWEACNW